MLCYLHEGMQVATQVAYDGKAWRMFEFNKTMDCAE